MNLLKIVSKIKHKKFNQRMFLIFLCPFIVGVIATAVMIGWIIHSLSLVQVVPNLEPMQFNTALCFLLFSNAFLISLTGKYHPLRIGIATSVIIIAGLTVLQYPLHTNWGIDTFLLTPFIAFSNHPGRMAPNTCLAFIFLSLSLCLWGSQLRLAHYRALAISLLVSLGFALGMVPLLGHITSIETAYVWGSFIPIPFLSAFCFVLLSMATMSYVWICSEKDTIWLPIPIFIACLATTIAMSSAVYNKELNHFNQALANTTQNATILTQQSLETLVEALNRMANRWEESNKTPSNLWHADAKLYLQDFPYLVALEILDSNLRIKAIEPLANNNLLMGKNLNQDEKRKKFIQKALKTRSVTVSDMLTLKQGGKGFLCFTPLFINHQFAGMLVAVFRAEDFFKTIFTKNRFSNYYVTVYEHGIPVFSNAEGQETLQLTPSYAIPLHYKYTNWIISLSPNKTSMANRVSQGYLDVLGFGLLMSLLVSLCTYLVLKFYEKSKALRESKNRYRMILDGLKDYAVFMLTPSGNVKSWNHGAQLITGYANREILGQHFSIFYLPNQITQNSPDKNLQIAKTQGKFEGENIQIRKDGSHFWAKIRIEPLYDETQKKLLGFVTITQNVTDSHQLEQERSKLIALIEESSDFMGIADLEGNLQYHNRGAKRMLGLPDDYDMSQLKIKNVHPSWAMKKIRHECMPAVFANGYWHGETALLHRSGKEIPVLQTVNLHYDAMGKPICFTTTMRDIAERKAKEDAIQASEEIFRAAMQYASIGMALVSTKGKWLKVNQSLCNMVGYTEEELLKIDFQSITHPDDLDSDLGKLQEMLDKKIESYQMEKRYLHKDGHEIWGLLDVSLLWDVDDKPKYFISQIQDITARKTAEHYNKELIAALANSNAELERFAYVASHDLQEPIRMINNFGELLLTEKQTKLDAEAKEYLSIMTNAGKRMQEMINDLLTYSRVSKEATAFANFDSESIFISVLENIKTLIEERKAKITHDPLPQLYGNPMQIMRLLQNLLANAIKYQPENNIPIIQVKLADHGDNWQISIHDNGIGIEEQFIEEIFEPFRRLHTWESIKGSGLGLSICKKIVENHGGTLTVSSIVGRGTTFVITLPKAKDF